MEEALARYPTTLKEDMAILEKDDKKEETLTYNQRNCVLYRSGEKEILEFLKTCSERFLKLFTIHQ